jgi:iron complex outermembrane receptor protein
MMEFNFGYYVPDSIKNPSIFQMIDYFGAKSVNVGMARVTGAEFTLNGTGSIGQVGITVMAGYTYIDPVNLNKDSAYNASGTDTVSGVLKYRFRHNAKADVELTYKKCALGFSMRYNSFMENIDNTFQRELLNDLFPTYHSGLYILPGLKEYREAHHNGDIIFDARFSVQLSKQARVSYICNNVLNREYMSRPGDMQPPRNMAVQVVVKF